MTAKTITAAVLLVVAASGLIILGSDEEDGGGGVGAPDLKQRFRGYDSEERALVRRHLHRALSRIDEPRSELAVAAAVNTYLHQFLMVDRETPGGGAAALAAGRGWCGSHIVAMAEMLYVAGIDSRNAALLGIRGTAANHSMLEVMFSDGSQGLFDPTHGAFFVIDDEPVGLARLVDDPALSLRALQTDVHTKRTSAREPVRPMRSIEADYDVAGDAAEVVDGKVSIRWRHAFAENRGWGIAYSPRELLTEIPVRAGQTRGLRRGGGPVPWTELARERTAAGVPLPWPHVIGDSAGYHVAHNFLLRGLRPGDSYALQFYVAAAQGDTPRLEIELPTGRRLVRTLPAILGPSQPGKRISVPIDGAELSKSTSVSVRASGSVLLRGIRLAGVAADT